jgi:site-specific recombinase XerD
MQTNTTQAQPKKLLDQVRDKIRFKHYSLSTENTYLSWIKQFILYHGKRHPAGMGAAEVESFLTYLATQRHVSSSTQNQALSAIRAQLVLRREWHEQDMALNKVDVWLPDALAVKYPNASKEWGWQYVFAAKNYSIDPRSKTERRHHVEEKQAALAADIAKPTTPHTLRHNPEYRIMSSKV